MKGRRLKIQEKLIKRSITVDRGHDTLCYEWTGPTSGNGRGGRYGRMCLDGATVATHIAGWTNEHGLIPPKKQLDHKCKNRLCWREDHLELVTHKQNQKRKKKYPAKSEQWTPEDIARFIAEGKEPAKINRLPTFLTAD